MFHRVKSETSPEAQEVQPAVSQVPASAPREVAEQPSVSEAETPQTESREETPKASEPAQAPQEPAQAEVQDSTASGHISTASFAQNSQSAPRSGPAPYHAGSYGSASYGQKAAAQTSTGNERKLTIGPGIQMSGEIEHCDHLIVEGTVEAALKGANEVHIAESGTFYGQVEIGEAVIAGRFEGDLIVNGRLSVKSTGVITGSIAYKEIEIESGAIIDGRLTPVSALQAKAQPAPKKELSAKNAAAKATKSAEQGQPANSDGELFANAAAAE